MPGKRVYLQAYLGDGLQKDHGVQYASNDWILSLDADERLEKEMVETINNLDLKNSKHDAYAFRRKTFVGDRWQKIWYPDFVTRLYDKNRCRYLPVKGHSKVDAKNLSELRVDMLHFSYKDFSDMVQKIDKFSFRGAKMLHEKGKKVSFLSPLSHGLSTFIRKYFLKKGIFYGLDGLTISIISAFGTYMKYAMLIELQKKSDI